MIKKVGFFAAFIILLYGVNIIGKWNSDQKLYKEGDTLEDISLDNLFEGDFASFYIIGYANKDIYVSDNGAYDVYTILVEHDTSDNINSYMQVLVKEQDTKQKLDNLNQGKVYFQGRVIDMSAEADVINKEWETGIPEGMDIKHDKLVANLMIVEEEVAKDGANLYTGIVLVVLAVVCFLVCREIQGSTSATKIKIKPSKFTEYNYEYSMQTHNIRNEWICEKDNLKKLQAEKIENDKVCKIMIVMFIIGVLIFIGDTSILKGSFLWIFSFILKLFSFVLMFIGLGGIWSKFINSSNELAVKIARKKGKRSLYLEIEECKKNIEELERIMEKQNIEEIENMFVNNS